MASVDAEKIQKHIHPELYGIHKSATFGDYRERIRDMAVFMGYTFIEEDR